MKPWCVWIDVQHVVFYFYVCYVCLILSFFVCSGPRLEPTFQIFHFLWVQLDFTLDWEVIQFYIWIHLSYKRAFCLGSVLWYLMSDDIYRRMLQWCVFVPRQICSMCCSGLRVHYSFTQQLIEMLTLISVCYK